MALIFSHLQGAVAPLHVHCQRRLLQLVVISGLISQIPVPASILFFMMGWGQPENHQAVIQTIYFTSGTVVAINFMLDSIASEPSSVFSPKPCRRQYFDFLTYFAEIMSPMNFGLFWEAIAETFLLFWIFNMLVKTLWTLVKTPFDNIGCPTSFSRSTSCGSFINLTI